MIDSLVKGYHINFTNEENILRWMIRGDTLYDVIIPEDADVVSVENKNTPNGVWRTNKIIVSEYHFCLFQVIR